MSSINFTRAALAAAIARGVRQCVVIGSRVPLTEAFDGPAEQELQVFAVGEEEQEADLATTFVPTQFAAETLATALEKSNFDKLKASLFVWLGSAGYRTIDAAMNSLAFIASLPEGSGVVLDYAAERTSQEPVWQTALDALASRMALAGGAIKYLTQPQAVTTMLQGLGFQKIVDLAQDGVPGGGHLVSALV